VFQRWTYSVAARLPTLSRRLLPVRWRAGPAGSFGGAGTSSAQRRPDEAAGAPLPRHQEDVPRIYDTNTAARHRLDGSQISALTRPTIARKQQQPASSNASAEPAACIACKADMADMAGTSAARDDEIAAVG
jgi:hypothetical protein